MTPRGRLALFAVAALTALGAGAALGAAVGPLDPPTPERHRAPAGDRVPSPGPHPSNPLPLDHGAHG